VQLQLERLELRVFGRKDASEHRYNCVSLPPRFHLFLGCLHSSYGWREFNSTSNMDQRLLVTFKEDSPTRFLFFPIRLGTQATTSQERDCTHPNKLRTKKQREKRRWDRCEKRRGTHTLAVVCGGYKGESVILWPRGSIRKQMSQHSKRSEPKKYGTLTRCLLGSACNTRSMCGRSISACLHQHVATSAPNNKLPRQHQHQFVQD
jgi:hypothetical protein